MRVEGLLLMQRYWRDDTEHMKHTGLQPGGTARKVLRFVFFTFVVSR